MKKSLSVLLVLLSLAGCSEQSSIENAIRQNLRDPESSQFRNLVVSKGSSRACIEWNAKNAFGGYSDWDVARLDKRNGEWSISQMQVPSADVHSCSQTSLDNAERTEAAVKTILEYSKSNH